MPFYNKRILILQSVIYRVLPGEQLHVNKLCLYERGYFTEPEMCSRWQKNSISYDSFRYSFVIAYVGFNIDVWQHNIHQNV